MADVLSPDLRDALRSTARGNPWRYVRASEPAAIGPLVSPMRYDILIRAKYFEFYADRRYEYRTDPDAYAARALAHPYRIWFEHVYVRTWRPHLATRPDALRAEWMARLRAAAELHDSFTASGFDSRHPVTLRAGVRVLTEHPIDRHLYAGDGNHRIALLIAAGQTHLEPDQYRIKRFLKLRPADTTAALAAVLPSDPREDPAFLALGDQR